MSRERVAIILHPYVAVKSWGGKFKNYFKIFLRFITCTIIDQAAAHHTHNMHNDISSQLMLFMTPADLLRSRTVIKLCKLPNDKCNQCKSYKSVHAALNVFVSELHFISNQHPTRVGLPLTKA